MRLRGRKLYAGMAGPDVGDLHRELELLGFRIPAEERRHFVFGVGTAAAVAHFQKSQGLWDTAIVEYQTARMLGRAIFEASSQTMMIPILRRPPARPAPWSELGS